MASRQALELRSGDAMPELGLGYRMVDTSGDYHTQNGIGHSIRASAIPREALFVVTKVEPETDTYEAAIKNLSSRTRTWF